MRNRWKVVIGIVVTVGILLAQQPVQLQTVIGGGNVLLGHGTASGALRVELPTDGTGQVVIAAGANAIGSVTVTGTPAVSFGPVSTSGGATTAFDLAATAATQVKATAGNVYGFYVFNPNTTACYLQFYNNAAATLGTGALRPIGVQAGTTQIVPVGAVALFNMSTAISTGETTTATGSTPCTSVMTATIFYQ